tara:strand:+ start:18 stop:485 length:468 start_codon:yes stop_codon:yes gene_type:complete
MSERSSAPPMRRPPRSSGAGLSRSRPKERSASEPLPMSRNSLPFSHEVKRTPRDGIILSTGGLLPANHRMQPIPFDNMVPSHSAPPCPGRNNTIYAQPLGRHPDSLDPSPTSTVPDGNFAKGGRVKKTGIYKIHKDEVVVPESLVKQLKKLMKKN